LLVLTVLLASFFSPKRLSVKMMRVVLSLYLTVAFFVTALHFWAEYQRTQSALTDELMGLERSVHDAVATSLWQMNGAQTEALMDGLLLMPIIEGVEIRDPEGTVSFGRRAYQEGSQPLDLFYVDQDLFWFARGREVKLGALRLYSSSSVILDRVLFGFAIIGLGAILKFTLLWWLFIWAFRRFLGDPLARLMDQMGEIQLERVGNKRIDLGTTDRNELAELQERMNAMLDKIDDDHQRLIQAEEERRTWLESEVKQRTKQLVEANQELDRIARTDYLTKTDNRRSFFEKAQSLIDHALRQSGGLCLIALDIDHFKRVNDSHGHEIGDQVLRAFSQQVRTILRKTDLFGRIGGEEFAILLPDTDPQGAWKVAEKIRLTVEKTPVVCGDTEICYTVSMGLVKWEGHETDISVLLKRGDDLLYQAKHGGRNRIGFDGGDASGTAGGDSGNA
jgi:diguanylate cyclase (GGDEF)-like protein